MPTLLSLFDASGIWSELYVQAGWNVVRIDLTRGHDLWEWAPNDAGLTPRSVCGIMAAPPCTHFAGSGAHRWVGKDASGVTQEAIRLVRRTLGIIDYLSPDWWVLENPVGRLNTCVPELRFFGPRYFNPSDYGDPYTKKTGLWGRFNMPDKCRVASSHRKCRHPRRHSGAERLQALPMRSFLPTRRNLNESS